MRKKVGPRNKVSGKSVEQPVDETEQVKPKVKKAKKRVPTMQNRMKKLQETDSLIMTKAPFVRLIRELSQRYAKSLRFTSDSLMMLQQAGEQMLHEVFENAQRGAIHAGRITVSSRDIKLYMQMTKPRWCKLNSEDEDDE
ncbi:hypothetical protein PCE1_004899 [Barthelona sp. PCE]